MPKWLLQRDVKAGDTISLNHYPYKPVNVMAVHDDGVLLQPVGAEGTRKLSTAEFNKAGYVRSLDG